MDAGLMDDWWRGHGCWVHTLERAGVKRHSLLSERHETLEQCGGGAAQLVQQQMLRGPQQCDIGCGHFNGLTASRREGQVAPRLKQHGLEDSLESGRLQRVDTVITLRGRTAATHARTHTQGQTRVAARGRALASLEGSLLWI